MDARIYKIAWVGVLLPLLFIGLYAYRITQLESELPDAMKSSPDPQTLTADFEKKAEPVDERALSVFGLSAPGDQPSDSNRYRLAGTFFMMGTTDASEESRRLAIIDDVADNRQYIVSEGEDFKSFQVLRVYKNRLILRRDTEEVVLQLSFTDAVTPTGRAGNQADASQEPGDYAATEYGVQIGERRWVLQKQALNNYYRTLLDNPQRIAALYMSMQPDVVDSKVAGYRIERAGEDAFFDAVGLVDGDIIRKVNSMEMTSQARGEYFLSEFVQDRLGALVLDIERDGKEEKMIYLFR